jgi:2-polyprenyl-3-methyl-5-hydroxy-6-metoxy-1,4-benzoquinol methylase
MQRIPEPELMDDPQQTQAYAEADFSEAHNAFLAHFAARFPGFSRGRVLDLGCGAADISVRFAQAFSAAQIVGVDGAAAMLQFARAAVTRAGCAERITLRQLRIPDSNAQLQAFDAVISNSLLHHLQDPLALWQSIKQAANPGAPVCVMDLMRPATHSDAVRLVQRYAAHAREILQRDFLNSLLAAYTEHEVRAQLAQCGFAYWQVESVSDRHLMIWGFR